MSDFDDDYDDPESKSHSDIINDLAEELGFDNEEPQKTEHRTETTLVPEGKEQTDTLITYDDNDPTADPDYDDLAEDHCIEQENSELSEPEIIDQLIQFDPVLPMIRDIPQIGFFEIDQHGVWYLKPNDKKPEDTIRTWISTPLVVLGQTRAKDGTNWGVLLWWRDGDGRTHHLPVKASLIPKESHQLLEALADRGLRYSITKLHIHLLTSYVFHSVSEVRFTSVSQPGWHNGHYVMGDSLGTVVYKSEDENERVFLQSDYMADVVEYKGSYSAWRNELAVKSIGNSRAVFALCLGFAASLSSLLELPTVCFNLRGNSSIGKTVLLQLAVSVNGTQVQSWRSTDNAFEMLAASSNHRLVVLDELGQAVPRTVGETVYMFANERGKRRMTATITSRPVFTWNFMVLSSSEIALADLLSEAGKQVKAGQEARFIDIPADAGCGLGVWEDLHNG